MNLLHRLFTSRTPSFPPPRVLNRQESAASTPRANVQTPDLNPTPKASPVLSPTFIKFTMPCPLSLPPQPQPGAGVQATPKTRILIAEDDPVSRELICARLDQWGYEVVITHNGTEAMAALRKPDAPSLAILDWMMPGMDGAEICRRVREVARPIYLILLTARGTKENIVEGLSAGADDYLIKPFDKDELQARILVGLRSMALQATLADRVSALEAANREVRELKLQLLM